MIRFIAAILLLSSCSCLKYEMDRGFLNSAQANVMEYPVIVQGRPCTDMDGGMGLCSKRVRDNQHIILKHLTRPYSYRIKITCSSKVNADTTRDVPKGVEFVYEIPHEKFKDVKSFICIGAVYPNDRDESISAKYEIRFKIEDHNYQKREDMFIIKKKKKSYLVLGKNALYSRVFQNGKWKNYKKKAVIKVRDKNIKAISESHLMRFNYYNL